MTPLRGHAPERPDAMISFLIAGSEAIPTVVFPHGATLGHRAWIPRPTPCGTGSVQ